MTKKKEEPPFYEVVSIIEKPHLCTWKENEGKRGFGTAKYKVLITDEDGNHEMVSCLNETDLTETADLGFDKADESYIPYEYDAVGVETFEEMVMFEYEINSTTILDAFDRAIDTLIESDIAITPELAEYFHLADGLNISKKRPIWAREMKERLHIENIARHEVKSGIRRHISNPDDKFDE
jgi:hypothetical protein